MICARTNNFFGNRSRSEALTKMVLDCIWGYSGFVFYPVHTEVSTIAGDLTLELHLKARRMMDRNAAWQESFWRT